MQYFVRIIVRSSFFFYLFRVRSVGFKSQVSVLRASFDVVKGYQSHLTAFPGHAIGK